MAEEEKKEGEAAEAPKGGKKKIIIIGAVVGLLVIGGAAFALMGGKKEEVAAAHTESAGESVRHYQTTELPSTIVNLSDPASFLKVSMLVEYDPEVLFRTAHGAKEEGGKAAGGGHEGGGGGEGPGKGLPGPLAKREGIVKDAIIRVISSRHAEDLLTTEGKEKLKEDLIDAINESSGLEEPVVVGVYFTEFIIQ